MVTKKKVSELVKSGGETQLAPSPVHDVMVEARLTKMELAEYLAVAAQEAFDAELTAAEAAVTASRRAALSGADLTPPQKKALAAYRSIYGGGDVHMRAVHSGQGPVVWIGAADRSGVVWDLPTEDIQKAHPLHDQYARAFSAYRAVHTRRDNFNPDVAKMQVVEAVLGGTDDGKAILTQLKGMVNRAVRGE